ncbi:MAG: threonine aldolase family protein [Parvibaculaceae bacterium]
MIFTSDNAFGTSPEILEALARVNVGGVYSYGSDDVTSGLTKKFSEIFERDVAVFPVATGTAANSLALATLTPPYGAIYCHEFAHVNVDECGAREMFSGGAKLVGIGGAGGKIDADALAAKLALPRKGDVHQVVPSALTITQSNESGGVYTLSELRRLTDIARKYELGTHMDGARFANALVALGCTPAEMTWKSGIDVLSFGATKNGAMAAEAVVFFDPAQARDFEFRRKRAGHLFSKMRFLSVQLEAYLEGDLWLRNARHANAMSKRLADGLLAIEGVTLGSPVEANEVFVRLPIGLFKRLIKTEAAFYPWENEEDAKEGHIRQLIRLVTSFATTETDVDRFIALAKS